MAPAPANVGPGTAPGGNPGNMAAATIDIGNGLKMLQRALPNLPMGAPLHTDILQAVIKISKHMDQSQQDHGLHAQGMMQAVRQSAQQAPQIAAMRAMGGGPSAPQSPPAMPPPEAA